MVRITEICLAEHSLIVQVRRAARIGIIGQRVSGDTVEFETNVAVYGYIRWARVDEDAEHPYCSP